MKERRWTDRARLTLDVTGQTRTMRPIELDNAGLVGAIRQRLAGLPAAEAGQQITVEMEHSDQLPALSPAVELAAYRIASEAINNALTHSEGRRCLVTITANGTLAVIVRDDGRPPTSWTPGIGLRSILERAENWAEPPLPGQQATAGRYARDCRWTGLRHPSRTDFSVGLGVGVRGWSGRERPRSPFRARSATRRRNG